MQRRLLLLLEIPHLLPIPRSRRVSTASAPAHPTLASHSASWNSALSAVSRVQLSSNGVKHTDPLSTPPPYCRTANATKTGGTVTLRVRTYAGSTQRSVPFSSLFSRCIRCVPHLTVPVLRSCSEIVQLGPPASREDEFEDRSFTAISVAGDVQQLVQSLGFRLVLAATVHALSRDRPENLSHPVAPHPR